MNRIFIMFLIISFAHSEILEREDVKNFIKKGGAQGLYKGKDPEYYGKNGFFASGKFNDLEKYYKSVDQRGGSAAFIYLFNMKDKKWYVYDYYKGDGELKRLY